MALRINSLLFRDVTGLNYLAWARLAAWTGIGVVIYLFYGVQHSILNFADPDLIHPNSGETHSGLLVDDIGRGDMYANDGIDELDVKLDTKTE